MTIAIDDFSEKYVNVSKLIYQLINGRVILERLPERLVHQLLSDKQLISKVENVKDTEENFNDDASDAELDFEQDTVNTVSNDDPTTSGDEETGYDVISTGYDISRKDNIRSHCYNCNESTVGRLSSKCPKCRKVCKMFQCDKCLIQFSKFSNLSHHIIYKCMPYKAYSCRKCDYRCYVKSVMLKHMKRHAKATRCPNCQRQFIDHKSATIHLSYCSLRAEVELNEKDAEDAEDADYRVVRKGDDNHDIVKRTNLIVHCDHCNKSFTKAFCSKCPKCHKICGKFQCGVCQRQYSKLRSLTHHLSYKCMPHETFFCRKCNFQCSQKSDINRHVKRHSKETQCPKCRREFINSRGLQTHLRFCDEQVVAIISDGPLSRVEETTHYRKTIVKNGIARIDKYMLGYCHNCTETSCTDRITNNKCPKCEKAYEKFQCGKCQVEYSTFNKLKNHLLIKCMPLSIFDCRKCDYQSNIECNILRHVKTH